MKRFIISLIVLFFALLPATAFAAYNPLSGVCSAQGGAGASSTACGTNGSDTISGKNGVLEKSATILASVAGIAAVIIIIIAGLTYVTSGGNAQKIESARTAIIGAIVGLVIIAMAAAIVAFAAGKA